MQMEYTGIDLKQPGYEAGPGYRRALMGCGIMSLFLLLGVMHFLGLPTTPLILLVVAIALVWFAYQRTTSCIGFFLFTMPFFTLLFLLAKFFGPPYVASLEGIDRGVLLFLTIISLFRNRLRFVTADWLILTAFCIAAIRLPLDGLLISLASDFGFLIAYFAGRVTVLSDLQQAKWARRAVWIVALVSVLGMLEVFVVGEGPRTLLYSRVAEDATWNGVMLNASFHATGFTGLRESATMLGPLQFGPLCMVALVIWWVYSRKALPGIMIAGGLVLSVTRSAWIGAFLAIIFLALVMGQKKKLLMYGGVALTLLVLAVPFIGIGDYLTANQEGTDSSAEQHRNSLQEGLTLVAQHPIGMGSANIGRQAEKTNDTATYFENAYLSLAGAYGIPVVLCILAFFAELLRVGIKSRTKLGFAVAGIVVGVGVALLFASSHDVFPLACWIWFPAGLLITVEGSKRKAAGRIPSVL